jgi:hypothetical protein
LEKFLYFLVHGFEERRRQYSVLSGMCLDAEIVLGWRLLIESFWGLGLQNWGLDDIWRTDACHIYGPKSIEDRLCTIREEGSLCQCRLMMPITLTL